MDTVFNSFLAFLSIKPEEGRPSLQDVQKTLDDQQGGYNMGIYPRTQLIADCESTDVMKNKHHILNRVIRRRSFTVDPFMMENLSNRKLILPLNNNETSLTQIGGTSYYIPSENTPTTKRIVCDMLKSYYKKDMFCDWGYIRINGECIDVNKIQDIFNFKIIKNGQHIGTLDVTAYTVEEDVDNAVRSGCTIQAEYKNRPGEILNAGLTNDVLKQTINVNLRPYVYKFL